MKSFATCITAAVCLTFIGCTAQTQLTGHVNSENTLKREKAACPNTPKEILKVLSKNKRSNVRYCVAYNPK